ncbi:MAG: PAS domain S-box protein [Leptolyngbyaceae cyanobacterium]
MTAPGPKVLFLLASSVEQERCQQLLAEAPTWQGAVISPGDVAATIGIAPEIVVMDRASDEAYWQTGQTGATSPLAVVWLLEDEDTWRSPADEPVAIYDYLYKSQLTAARLGLTIQNLWRQCHLQRQLDHCHHRDEVLDHAGVGTNQADASGRYIRVNQQFCTLLGYTEAELLQLTYQAVTHPDDLEAQVEIERQIFGGNLASHTFEKRYLTKAGDPVWARVTLSAIYDANHRPVSDLAVVEDINIRVSLEKQRHQAEADLKAQRDFLQVLLDHLPISLFVKQAHPDRFGEFVLVNSVCESFFGQQREQIIGKTDYDLFTAEQAAAFAEVDRQVMASQDTQTLEEVVDRPHVGLQTLHTVKVPIYDADQRPQYLLGISLDITAQRQAEHALRAHQQFVQRITENSPNAIYIYDLTQHRYTFVNREIYSLLGYAKEDVNEQMQGAALALMHPDEQEPLTQHLARLSTLSDGEFAEIEYRIRHKNGEWRWFLSRDRVFQRDEAGRVTQVLGNAQDITSIKQSQLALKESEALYSDMMCSLDSASVARFRVTAEGHWEREYQSPGCESVFGYTAAELCQDSTLWRSRVEATDLERVIDPLLDTFFDHRTATAEYRFHHGDGSLRWIASTYVLRYDETRHHWLVTAIAYDITDRKLTKHALVISEEQLRLALEFGHVALWDWDAATEQITWNPIGYEIFGYQEDEIELTYDFWRQCLHPDDRQAADASITQSIAEQRNLALEYRILRPDGTQRWIFDTGRGIYDDTGAFTRAIGIALDITDRKQAELERQQTTEELHRFLAVALDLLCIANVDGYFLRLNPAWEAALGYAIEELTQQPFIDFVHPDDVPSTLDAIAQLQAQQEIRNFVNRYRHREGSYRWLEWRSIPVGDLIYAAARDITDRQRTELRIRHQNALLAQIAKGEPLADILTALVQTIEQQLPSVLGSILLLDDNNRLRYGASHKLPAIYLNLFDGVEIGDGVGSCGTAAWRRATTLVADIAQDPLWRDYRELALSFDLRACWSFPITGSGGQVLGVFGIYTPTSGFPQAEEQQTIEQNVSLASIAIERQRSEVAVKTSEARFRQIAETVCEGFYVVDLEAWHDSYFNPAFTAITGFSEAAICHDRDFWLNHIHRDDRDRINDIVQRDLMQGLSFDEEYRFIRLDGEIRWLRSQCFPIVNQNGIVTRIIGTVEDISDRKQAEAALRESEQRYATLAELSPNAVYRFDAQGQCVYVNPRWCEMTGRTVEQGYGDDWIQVLHPEDRDRLLAGLQEAFDQRTYLRNQGRHLLPDGSVIWFDAQIAPELDEKGYFLGFVGTLTDITEIKQAEFALRASEARFKRLAEACPGVIFTLVREADGTFHFEYLSPAFEALHEIPVETAYQDAAVVFNQIHPDDRPGYEQAAQESIGTLQTFHYECRFVTPSGLKWLQISTQPSHREGQQVTVCYGIALEITHRKQAELALRVSEERYTTLVENSPIGVFRFDPAGECVYVNPRWCEMTGRTLATAGGNQWPEILHPNDRERLLATWRAALAQHTKFRAEGRHIHTEGNIVWFDCQMTPEVDHQGNLLGYVGTVSDITDRKQAEFALHNLNAELEARVHQRTQELARSEQDLRTIFNNVYDAIFLHDLDGTIIDINDRAIELLGATREQLVGAFVADISSQDAPVDDLPQKFQRARQGESLRLEWIGQRLDNNHTFDLEVSVRQVTLGEQTVILAGARDISDRKRIEVALAESEAKFRRLVEGAKDLIWAYDADANFTYLSPQFQTLFGWEPSEWLGKPVAALVHPDDLPVLLAEYQGRFSGNVAPQEYSQYPELRHRHRDGHYIWVRVSGTPIHSPDGDFLGAQGVLSDISDRKQAEAALQESRNMLELVLNAIPQRVFWKDRHSTYLGCNSPFAHDHQLAPPDIVGKVDTDFYQAERASLYQQEDQQVISTRAAKLNYEELLTTPQGEQLWLRTSKIPLTNSQGEVVGILGCYEDITDRKQAELALQESEERLRLALLAANQGLYDLDLTTGEVVVSPTYATMLGHDPANFQETFTKWQQRMHPADRERMDQHVKAYLTGQIPEYYVEFRQQLPDGTYKWILSMAKIVAWDEAGQPQRVIGTHADIQERKQAEADLQESRNMLELVLNAIPQRVFWKDRNSKFLGCNPAFAHDYRLTSADIIGKTDSELPWAEWAELYNGDDQEIIKTQTPRLNYEEPGTNFQGEPIWLRTSKIPLTNSQGEVVGILGCYEDITDRKQTELALQESEARFRQIANSINEVFWLTTPDHKILYVSPAYEQVWGRSAEAITADSWLESLHPDDRDQLLTQVDAALPQFPADLLKPNSEVEYRIVRPDGTVRWIRDRAFPIYDDQGQIYRIAGVAEDITDRKSLEQEQQRLLSILEAAPDHIGLATPDGTVIWNNRQAKLIRGLPLDADVTHYPIESYHPQWALEIIQQVGLPTAMQQGFWLGETALLSADDTEIPVSQFILAHRGPTGEVEYLSTIIRDISLLKQAEQTLRQTNTDLENRIAERTAELLRARDVAETANQAKSIFLANMSHELRTPLNAILGFSQLMGRDHTLSSKHIENLQVINRSGEHLLALINDILEMSKIEAGQVTFNPEPFDLPQLLASLIEMLQLKAESKGLALSQVSGSEVPQYIYTDSNKLRQVLLNLVGNAIKFTQRGYVTLRVTPTDLAGQPVPPQLCHHTAGLGPTTALQFEVEDSGVGIAPEELSQLFEPFVQTASGRLSQEGTGLGLPISQQFVQMMGGDLTVTSQPHVGSTFAFTVPVQLVKPAAVELSEVPRRVVAIAPAQPAYRILIVEDNWANRLLLQNLLADLGFTVKMAENGQDAIGHWQHWQPHLIFMDIRMPVMNGYEATHIIRQREQGQQQATKIICLTAGIFEDAHTDFDAAGFDDCIYKPIQQRDVTTAIAQHLGVEFLYETATPAAQASSNAATVALTAETLQVLPQNWLVQFYQALIELNQSQMLVLIDNLPPDQAAVAQALRHKVREFDFEPLLEAIKVIVNP